MSRSPGWPAAAAAVVTVQPVVSTYSVQSEGAIYLAAFSVWALGIGVRARSRNWLWPLAGILAGLANLSRSEGLILIVLLLVAAAGGQRQQQCRRQDQVSLNGVQRTEPAVVEEATDDDRLLVPQVGVKQLLGGCPGSRGI